MERVTYEVLLYLDGILIGNIREIAQSLTWVRQRTRMGVDSITFTVNDYLLANWCQQRAITVTDLLRPMALECRVLRNGIPVVGGFLATMPAYSSSGQSADLSLSFDGFINLLAGVYLHPSTTQNGAMGVLIKQWIDEANSRSTAAGKGFGLTANNISSLPNVAETLDNYISIKDVITNRCDNVTGAGPFEVYFYPDKNYDIVADADFGDDITDYIIQYPAQINGVNALSLSAKELTGFASTVIGIGSGEVSNETVENPAPISIQTNSEAVKTYGYAESILQESSISVQESLDRNVAAELNNRSTMVWQPQIKLSGTQVAPIPTGTRKIWIGDTVMVQNNADYTGMTSGSFRVNTLSVSVDGNNAEDITPTLSRGDAINTNSFAKDFIRMKNELLGLKTGK